MSTRDFVAREVTTNLGLEMQKGSRKLAYLSVDDSRVEKEDCTKKTAQTAMTGTTGKPLYPKIYRAIFP